MHAFIQWQPHACKSMRAYKSMCCHQVPIHTVTLDVQDHEKTQQFPAQLPKDFQEVRLLQVRLSIACFRLVLSGVYSLPVAAG